MEIRLSRFRVRQAGRIAFSLSVFLSQLSLTLTLSQNSQERNKWSVAWRPRCCVHGAVDCNQNRLYQIVWDKEIGFLDNFLQNVIFFIYMIYYV